MAGRCPKELEAEFIQDCAHMPTQMMSTKYGKSLTAIKEWRLQLYHDGKLSWWPGIRIGDCKEYNESITIAGDVMVIADLEIPYHNVVTLGYVVAIAKKFNIRKLLIAGDFIANDAVGHYAGLAEDTDESTSFTLSDSLLQGETVLEDLFTHFDEIYLIKGNHEQRGNRIKEIGFFDLMRRSWEDTGDLEISYYRWCMVGKYRVEHPTYRKVPGSIARERAEIEDNSVLCAHTHGFSYSFTKNGKFEAVDLGHCTRPETRYYKAANGIGAHPKWIAGFWMIRNEFLYGFPIDFTDWGFWLEELQVEAKKER